MISLYTTTVYCIMYTGVQEYRRLVGEWSMYQVDILTFIISLIFYILCGLQQMSQEVLKVTESFNL